MANVTSVHQTAVRVRTFVGHLAGLLLFLQLVEELLGMAAYLHCCLCANVLCKVTAWQ